MKILKRNNWFLWLLINILSAGCGNLALAALLDVYDENAWYNKWYYWLLAFCFLFFPFAIMVLVFSLQITCQVAAKLGVMGSEIYLTPYIWLLIVIVPFIGWFCMLLATLYLEISILVALATGAGEKYISN